MRISAMVGFLCPAVVVRFARAFDNFFVCMPAFGRNGGHGRCFVVGRLVQSNSARED